MALNSDRNHTLAIKLLNLIVFFFFFGSNLYTSLGGPSTGYYSQKETYITPAPETFWIWTVINLLFLGFVIFQFFEIGTKLIVEIIGWRFAGIGILQSIWIHLFVGHHYILAFVLALIVASLVSHVYWDLRRTGHQNKSELVFVHLPFSLLHAYLVFLLVLSAFTAFGVDKSDHHAGLFTKLFVNLALLTLAFIAVGYAFQSDKGDVAGSIVIALELIGVFIRQSNPKSIHWVALVSFIITLFAIVKAIYFNFRSGRISLLDSERAPLIG
ncbi:hypothetical protein DFH28DRAFT_1020417 [Melampsora americana]|nr:hypothetical protein DFH28DRAFT_1020417 [Melampsora americana]